jgi:hypothetical protein
MFFRAIFCLFLGWSMAACQSGTPDTFPKSGENLADSTCGPGMQEPKASPMAAAMRAMADQAEAMRAWIVSDSSNRPARPAWAMMPFEAQRPTDTTVLVEEFFEKAKAYHEAHRLVGQQPTAQHFDALIARCIACHQSHCPGPLKRINRLMIGS